MVLKRLTFWMNSNDYDDLQKVLVEDERSMAGFLRFAIRKELNSDSIPDTNQILILGHRDKKDHRQVNFLMDDNEFVALKKYLKNGGLTSATFYRYLTKKELRRLDIEKEKNQTWDIE